MIRGGVALSATKIEDGDTPSLPIYSCTLISVLMA